MRRDGTRCLGRRSIRGGHGAGLTRARWMAYPLRMLRGARALIEAIVDRPDEDAPRLLYADHVRDRDAPRAELIAVQCALPRATVESERTALRRREFALLQEHKARWLAEVGLQMGEGQFLRGFVEEIELLVERLGVATGDLVQLAPVRQVRILETRIGRISPVADLAGAPLLRRAESLELRDCRLEADGVRRLFGGAFDRLRRLSLRRAKLDAAGVQALLEGEALASVTTLDLAGNELRNAGAESLAQSTRLASLERLDLTRNNVADAGASALAGTDALPRLEVLRLPTNTIHEEGALALARSSALAALTLLDVHDNFVGKRGALALDAAFGPRCRLR